MDAGSGAAKHCAELASANHAEMNAKKRLVFIFCLCPVQAG
jgi:hypothetical protein